MKLWSYLKLIGVMLRVNVKASLEYRANFLLLTFGMVMNNAAFILFWRVVIDKGGDLGGYGFNDIMYIWALGASAFGLGHIFFGNASHIGQAIRNGNLDVFLLQPRNALISILASRTQISAWGDFAYGIIVFAIIDGGNLLGWLWFGYFCITGAALYIACFALYQSLTFWIGDATALGRALSELLLSGTLYPKSIYAEGVRWIYYALLPTAFITFIPLDAWRSPVWWAPLVVLGMAVFWVGLSFLVFARGLKRYESGNLLSGRT